MVVVVAVLNGNMKAMAMTLGGTGMKKLHDIPQETSIGMVGYWLKDSVSVSRFSGQTFQFLSPFLSNGLSFCKTGNVCGKKAGAVLLCQGGHNSNWNRTWLAFLFRLLARV